MANNFFHLEELILKQNDHIPILSSYSSQRNSSSVSLEVMTGESELKN